MTDLDDKLTSMAAAVPDAARAEVLRMAEQAMPRRVRRGRAPRSRWALPIFVGGAIVLTAGAGTATIAMSHWSGVEMSLGNVRNSEPIPVIWTTDTGHSEECRVWLEFRNPEPGDQARLNEAVAKRDWSGLGQQLYDDAPALPGPGDGEDRVSEALTPEIQAFTAEVFPGISWFDEDVAAGARAVDVWGMTCVAETN